MFQNPLPDAANTMQPIASLSRLRPSLAACLVLVASASFAADPVIDGPDKVEPFKLVRLNLKDLPEGGSAVWEVYPFEADGLEADGGRDFAFVGPPGIYNVSAVYLLDGKLGKARYSVTIGNPPPPVPPTPVPPVPIPPDPGNLTGLAKLTFDAAKAQNDPATAKEYAENYAASLSAIAAGVYNGLAFEKARTDIFSDVASANRSVTNAKPAWRTFGATVTAEMNRLQQAGQLNSVEAITKAFGDIHAGLEAASR